MESVKVTCSVKERILASGKGSLYLDLFVNGKRSRETLKLFTSGKKRKTQEDKEVWALAEKIRAKKIVNIAEGKYGFEQSGNKSACFVAYFKVISEEEERRFNKGETKARTYSTYKSTLKHLESFTGGSLRFSALDEQWLEAFKRYLMSDIPSPRTQSTYFSKIRAVVNKAYRERVISYNPVPAVKHISKGQSEKIFLLEEELELLSNAKCPREVWKRAFLFSCFTGLRLSDIEALTWAKIQGDKIHFRQQKTDGFEYLPLSETALEILELQKQEQKEHCKGDSRIFQLEGRAYRGRYLKTWAHNAGIDKAITYHSSRHTFATLLLTKGVDLYCF